MERIMKIFNTEFSKISEVAIVLGFFTLMAQILAIFRDRFLAGNIGAGSTLDVYYAAFRIPDLLFTLGASLVSVSILMPFFKAQLSHSKIKGKEFINEIFTVFFFFITFGALVCIIVMPFLANYLFPGFNPSELKEVILLSRIMLLSPIILGISNLFATITQAAKKFFVYALAPVFYNIGIILGIVLLYPQFGVVGLGYGVIIGAMLHMFIQLPVVIGEGFRPRFTQLIDWKHVRKVIKHSLPRTITLSMSKIVFLIFVSIASALATGSISVLTLAYNLQSVPLAIIGVSYSVAAFPILVDYYNSKDHLKFIAHVMGPIRQIVFWSLPIISLFVILRAQIVRVILGTGNFDWADTRLTAATLALFIISVVAQSVVLLLIRAYYAAEKTWKPLWITLFSSMITIIFGYIFITGYNSFFEVREFFEGFLRIKNVVGSSVIMLPLAYSLGMFINLGLLWHGFKKDFNYSGDYGIKKSFFQSLCASLIIASGAYLSLKLVDPYFSQETTMGVFGHGFISGMFGLILGILFLRTIKNNEIQIFLGLLKKKVWKTKINIQEEL
jgi:putative peptidoglycan lipid II flippase